jgi:hypothetical protein
MYAYINNQGAPMQNNTIELITAIQTGNPDRVRVVLKKMSKTLNRGYVAIELNKGLPRTGLTPLHVACRLYKMAQDDVCAAYDQIIMALLVRGACTGIMATIGTESITPIDTCKDRMPPSLLRVVRQRAEDTRGYNDNQNAKSIEERAAKAGIGHAKYLSLSRGYATSPCSLV